MSCQSYCDILFNVFLSDLSLSQDFTQQKYLASMEGAVLSGKLCAKQINDLSRELKAENVQEKAVAPNGAEVIQAVPAFVVI